MRECWHLYTEKAVADPSVVKRRRTSRRRTLWVVLPTRTSLATALPAELCARRQLLTITSTCRRAACRHPLVSSLRSEPAKQRGAL